MWDFPNQALIRFPSFISTFRFKLRKGSEIILEFWHFWWGKYIVRKLFAISSHVTMVFFGNKLNQVFALSFKEKRKSSIWLPPLTRHWFFTCHISQGSLIYARLDHHVKVHQIDMYIAPFESTTDLAQSRSLELLVIWCMKWLLLKREQYIPKCFPLFLIRHHLFSISSLLQ